MAGQGPEDPEKLFQTQLARTGAAYLTATCCTRWTRAASPRWTNSRVGVFFRSLRDRGLARSIGFSFHDTADVLETILSAHPEVDFVQLQINYLDWEDDKVQARACYECARAHGVDVVVMEPVKGGVLAALPEIAARPLRALHPDWSDARWALAFCLTLPVVATVLSGMSDFDQLTGNLETFRDFEPLNEAELAALRAAAKALDAMPSIPCTGCGYCVEGCPRKINIPGVFETATSVMRFGPRPSLHGPLQVAWPAAAAARDCVACRPAKKAARSTWRSPPDGGLRRTAGLLARRAGAGESTRRLVSLS